MPYPDDYRAASAPDAPLDTSGPCAGDEELAEKALPQALKQIENFADELTARGADTVSLAKAIKSLMSDIEDWRNK